jgi:hypothetical protein
LRLEVSKYLSNNVPHRVGLAINSSLSQAGGDGRVVGTGEFDLTNERVDLIFDLALVDALKNLDHDGGPEFGVLVSGPRFAGFALLPSHGDS